MIGNVAFILFSGGYDYADTMPHFEAGCARLKEAKPDVAFIAGHWNDYELGALGCKKKMAVPGVYSEIRGFGGCKRSMQIRSSTSWDTRIATRSATDPRGGPTSALGMMVAGQDGGLR